MTTKLTKEIKREVVIDGDSFTVTLTTKGVRLSRKRGRFGAELTWAAIWENASQEWTKRERHKQRDEAST